MEKLGSLVTIISILVSSLAVQQMAMGNELSVSCGSVTANLMACVGFITNKDTTPSSACCSGAKKVADMAPTKPDRQAVCECIKTAAKSLAKIDYARIPEIPKACNIDVTMPTIKHDTDCSTIAMLTMSLY